MSSTSLAAISSRYPASPEAGFLEKETYPWKSKYGSDPANLKKAYNVQEIPPLFQPITIRNLTLKNRIVVSPMCMYSANKGWVGDFHLVHLGAYALGGAALVFMEATGVSLEARISPYCPTLHDDDQIPSIRRIADFVHASGAAFGIQLAHAGRKASTPPPFEGRSGSLDLKEGDERWEPIAPSPIAYAPNFVVPKEMSKEKIESVKQEFIDSVIRAEKAGIDVIEIHAAHGYLLNQFLSPTTNHRTDEYGGSFENRTRLLLEVIKETRKVWSTKPLFVRLSCEEGVEGGWSVDDTVKLVAQLKELEVDVVDCSSAGNSPAQKINPFMNYQVPYAERCKKETGILSMAVGMIRSGKQANEIISNGFADLVAIGRQHLRDPFFSVHAASELTDGVTHLVPQYHWAVGVSHKL